MKMMISKLNKPKVAVFSDLHLGVHSNSSHWHSYALEWANWFKEECEKEEIEDIIFCGDWHHNRSEISVNTLQVSADILDILSGFNLIIITGNHDIYYKHRTDVNSISIFKNRRNVTILDTYQTMNAFNRKISFCPWNTTAEDIEDSDAIFGHFEIETFRMTGYKVCEEGMKIRDLLSKSSRIISGHFHTRHEKTFGAGSILYVGNPFQMDFGDADNQKGFYIFDFNTLEYEFRPNNISPCYKKISLSELVEQNDITPIVVNNFSNNFVKLKIDMNISQQDLDTLYGVLTKLKPESLTIDYDINFNRIIENTEHKEDLSGIDIKQAIVEFVNMLDIEDSKDIIDYTLSLYEKC